MIFSSLIRNVRSYFFYGLIIVVPVAATMFVVYIALQFLLTPFGDMFGENVSPLLSLVVALSLITVMGFLSRNFVGKFMVDAFEIVISKIPFVSRVYESTKHITDVFSGVKRKEIKAVLVEYPKKEMWVIGFLTFSSLKNVEGVLENSDQFVSVFIPTTPNPTSGYMVYVHQDEVKPLDIGFEEAIKTLVSAGIVGGK